MSQDDTKAEENAYLAPALRFDEEAHERLMAEARQMESVLKGEQVRTDTFHVPWLHFNAQMFWLLRLNIWTVGPGTRAEATASPHRSLHPLVTQISLHSPLGALHISMCAGHGQWRVLRTLLSAHHCQHVVLVMNSGRRLPATAQQQP